MPEDHNGQHWRLSQQDTEIIRTLAREVSVEVIRETVPEVVNQVLLTLSIDASSPNGVREFQRRMMFLAELEQREQERSKMVKASVIRALVGLAFSALTGLIGFYLASKGIQP